MFEFCSNGCAPFSELTLVDYREVKASGTGNKDGPPKITVSDREFRVLNR